ncbi:unnamed protein product [Blepharisma stoltei]|uniref:FYVE-type domain-containing protein n=1 Tax=Blepharisma stoltei TaxID=1481888 RepID=A0AAU9IG22_9CILI|nr:unnamed protein product [Blepharisma stoltei]
MSLGSLNSSGTIKDSLPNSFDTSYLSNPKTDKSAYKKDKNCSICGSPFTLLGSTQKNVCQFCYHGVCGRCCSQTVYEAIKDEALKICDNCYSEYIKTQVTSKIQFEIMDVKAQNRFIEEQIVKEQKAYESEKEMYQKGKQKYKEIEEKIDQNNKRTIRQRDKIQASIGRIGEMMIKLEAKVEELSLIAQAKEIKVNNYKNEISDIQGNTDKNNNACSDIKNSIEEYNIVNTKINDDIVRSQEEQELGILNSFRPSDEVELTFKLRRLRTQIEEQRAENKRLEKKKQELRKEGGAKTAAVSALSTSLLVSQGGSNPVTFCAKIMNPIKIMKIMKEKAGTQEEEINALKKELEEIKNSEKIDQKEDFKNKLKRNK